MQHMHHGYYIPENRTDHVQAQIDLIDEVLKWADVKDATSVVDVGCGIGGSSRHIARKYDCKAQGITLSPYQANRGNELAAEQGVADQASFQVRKIETRKLLGTVPKRSTCCVIPSIHSLFIHVGRRRSRHAL
jgi:cyclopropane fatty-acyl-phospholipid synthase-like methyltransferase